MCNETGNKQTKDKDLDIGEEIKRIWARLGNLEARLYRIEGEKRPDIEEAQAFLPTAQQPQGAIESWQTQLAQAKEEIKGLKQAKLADQKEAQSQIAELRQLLEQQKQAAAQLEEAQANQKRLEEELLDLDQQLKNRNKEIKDSQAAIELMQKRELPCQEQLRDFQDLLSRTPPELAELAKSRGYNLDNLPAFLTSCGKIENLRQLWEACAIQARDGRPLTDAGPWLEKLLEIFNAGFPKNQARLITAKCGGKYCFEEQDRGASNGDVIAEVVLPGMRTPGGTVVKCVVRLN